MRRRIDLGSDERVRLVREHALNELRADLLRTSYRAGRHELDDGTVAGGYFDKYRFGTNPALLRRLGRFLAEMVEPTTNRLAAPALGAALIGVAVSLETGLPCAVVRTGDAEQQRGARPIEGGLNRGEVVTLVEDVVVSGARATRAIEQLRREGAVVTAVISVIDGMAGATNALPSVEYRSLFTVEDLGLPNNIFRIS